MTHPTQPTPDAAQARPLFPPPVGWKRWLWAFSPALIVLPFLVLFGWEWKFLSWVGFLGGVLNAYFFSAMEVWRRGLPDWELRAVPVTLLVIAVNAGLVFVLERGLHWLGVSPVFGAG